MIFRRKKYFLLLVLSVLLLGFYKCKPEFSVNSNSEPFTVVYGLLSASEESQYIKIFKSFLTEGNAYDVAKDINQYSYIDSIEVYLNEYSANNPSPRKIPLDTTTTIPKDSGVFLYPTQILYTTNAVLNRDCTYELVVFNPYTNNVTKTKLPFALAGNVRISRPMGPDDISITDRDINFVFYTGKNTTMYQLLIKYYYTEDLVDNTSRHPAPVIWTLGAPVEDMTAKEGIEKGYFASGTNFFRRIAESIHDDANVRSRHTDSIVLEIHSAAKDWGLYLKSNIPSTGINQDKLHYSNMEAYNVETKEEKYAMGMVSSREVTTKRYRDLTIVDGSRDSLFHGRYTKHLKFTDIY
ncbi:MAG: hypothetical protein LBG80_08195 [Bacteroidales bacterium]|jgi:hypothetical protein|nr:hypothetical protein [Bacteroidales bacterium]